MKVIIENFKSIKYLEIELAPVTFLLGPPASGKSNIMDAIAFAGYFNRFLFLNNEYGGQVANLEPLTKIARFTEPRSLFRHGYLSETVKIKVQDPRKDIGTFVVGLAYKGGRPVLSLNHEEFILTVSAQPTRLSEQARISLTSSLYTLKREGVNLYEARLYGYDRYALGQTSCLGNQFCGFHVYAHGEKGLPFPTTVLSELGWNIVTHTKSMSDVIVRLNTVMKEDMGERVEVKVLRDGSLVIFDYDIEIELDSVSDAIFRVLYYLTALKTAVNYAKVHGLEGRMVVMLEEPAAHVFPYFLNMLADKVREASKTVKVVINTHNPLLVSAIWDRVTDVRTYYVYRGKAGSTTITEIDIKRLAADLTTPEDIMSMRVSEVVKKYNKKR